MFDYGFLLRSTFRGTRDKTMAALGRNRQMKLVKKLNKHAQKLLKHEKLHISEESTPVILSVFYAFDDIYILVVCFQLFDLSTILVYSQNVPKPKRTQVKTYPSGVKTYPSGVKTYPNGVKTYPL